MRRGFCNGVIVSERGHVLTPEHCIDDFPGEKTDIKILYNGELYTASILAINQSYDIAILKMQIEDESFRKLPINPQILPEGQTISYISKRKIKEGAPLAGIIKLETIVKKTKTENNSPEVTISMISGIVNYGMSRAIGVCLVQGDSGSTVIDEKGNLIGIIMGVSEGELNKQTFFYTNGQQIASFIADYLAHQREE